MNGTGSYPIVHAQIEPTTQCNFRCPKCTNRDVPAGRRGHLTPDNLKLMLDRMPFVRDVSFCGLGETFMNPRIMSLFEETRSRGIVQRVTTNASLLHEFDADEILRLMEKIHVSFDAATAETFERVRRGASFERVVENVKNLARVKRENARPTIISMNCVVTRDNVHEMEAVPALAKDLGFDRVSFVSAVQLVGVGGKNSRIENLRLNDPGAERDLARALERLCAENGLGFSFADSRPRLPGCWWPRGGVYVTFDGWFTPCCLRMDPTEYTLGNILEKPFEELYNGGAWRAFRESFSTGNYAQTCINCPG
ncbi:MAG: radical SAM protein [bacterium]